MPNDNKLVNYVAFCKANDAIFTDANLEKDPTAKPMKYVAPSILDPKDIITDEEE